MERGHSQFIKELLNKEYNLSLVEEKNIFDFRIDLIDSRRGSGVIILEKIPTKLDLNRLDISAIEKFIGQYKSPTLHLVFPRRINNSDINLINTIKSYNSIGIKIKVLDILEVIRLAEKHNISYENFIESLAKNDRSLIDLLPKTSLDSDFKKQTFEGTSTFQEATKDVIDFEITDESSKLKQIPKELLNHHYFLAGHLWDGEDQLPRFIENNIWENGHNKNDTNTVGTVSKGDYIFIKSTFASKEGISYLRIKAVGYVFENLNNGRNLKVAWRQLKHVDIENLGKYRRTFQRIMPNDQEIIIRKIISDISSLPQILENLKNEADNIFNPPEDNITRIAGLQSDSDAGTDYLNISEDVTAFARVMNAKSFTPPLAIGLLGKWGSGKSFFMRKLQEKIQELSRLDTQDIYCKGTAHVHFNVWSYMDSNLWASIVTKIFEGLNLYIKNEDIEEEEKRLVKEEIARKLNITNKQVSSLEAEKAKVDEKIKGLKHIKQNLNTQLRRRIKEIKDTSLSEVLENINTSFNIDQKIKLTLKNNDSYIKTSEQLKALVPEEYWKSPTDLYNRLNSKQILLRQFFKKETWKENWIWLAVIAIIIAITPILMPILLQKINGFNFTIPSGIWYSLSSISAILVGINRSYKKLSPLIASFWKIKEDYSQQKESAVFEFHQKEKALQLEIKNYQSQIDNISDRINQANGLAKSLEFQIKETLSTETLFNFIEKKASSADYKQYLGIVSIIRKDFEILSNLFRGSIEESEKNKNSKQFKDRFKNPLDRIILYIDDLDRCSEERVVEVLEAVNLLMAFPLFIVVVGVDPRWVKNALQEKYKLQFAKNEEESLRISPSNYLEKIFQIPFHLKEANDKSVENMIGELVKSTPELSNNKEDSFNIKEESEKPIKDIVEEVPEENFNEEKIDTIQTTKDHKERIEALKFSERELQLLKEMSIVVGTNPRAIKRFINIYRVIKAHDDFVYSEETKYEEILCILFLVALSIGKYKKLSSSFKVFLESEKYDRIYNYWGKKNSFVESNDKDLILRRKLFNHLSEKNHDLLRSKKEFFVKHYKFISRFSFS